MAISEDDLIGSYTWIADSEPAHFTGVPSRRTFDRYSGNQLLFIIDALAALSDSFSVEDIRNVESKIENELPMNTQSEISVYNWLRSQIV